MADNATQEDQCHPRKLFVGGLTHKTTTQNLRDYFGHYGAIVDAVVLRWPDGRSRGFGYVTFAELASASSALREPHQIGGRDVDVKRAVPGTNKLFVGGLPQNAAAFELREHFETFGTVSDAVVMIDPATSRSRGFGFVCYLPGPEGAAAVAAALEQYRNHRIRGKWIEVKSAAPPHKLVGKEGLDASPSSAASDFTDFAAASPVSAPPGLPASARPSTRAEPRKVSVLDMADPSGLSAAKPSPVGDAAAMPPGLSNPAMWQASPLLPWQCAALPRGGLGAGAPAASQRAQKMPQCPPGEWQDPVKVQIPSKPGYFDASNDLQRSLEQLLRMHAQGPGVKAEGKLTLPVGGAPSGEPYAMLEEAASSPTKREH